MREPGRYRCAVQDDVSTGPIVVVDLPAPRAVTATDSFSFLACSFAAGALTLSATTIELFASFGLAAAVVALAMSLLGLISSRPHTWACWVGLMMSAGAGLISATALFT